MNIQPILKIINHFRIYWPNRFLIQLPSVFSFTVILILSLSSVSFAQNGQIEPELKRLTLPGSTPELLMFSKSSNLRALNLFETFKQSFNLKAEDAMEMKNFQVDDLGYTHYRFQQKYRGVPVFGIEYLVHEKDDKVVAANGRIIRGLTLSVEPALKEGQALTIALNFVNKPPYLWQDTAMENKIKILKHDPQYSSFPKGELVLVNKKGFQNMDADNFTLAWKFDIHDHSMFYSKTVFVDAHLGSIVNSFPLTLSCEVGTALTTWYGKHAIHTSRADSSYYLLDNCPAHTAKIHTYGTDFGDCYDEDNDWSDPKMQGPVTSHWGVHEAMDFFAQSPFGRNSFDNYGHDIMVRHRPNYNGAQFNSSTGIMTIGMKNDISLGKNFINAVDVCGHEFAHGVIYSSNFGLRIYQGESGALNESFADIFGVGVQRKATGVLNWTINEQDIDGFIRDLSAPKNKGQPDYYMGENWKSTMWATDNGGVHTNSGVQNYWFYLLAVGKKGINENDDKYDVQGIGFDKAIEIAYRALGLIPAPADYQAARIGSLLAAEFRFGKCSDEWNSVANAWYAVGVGEKSLMINSDSTKTEPASCDAGTDGTAKIKVEGGSAQISYAWDDANAQTTQTATDLTKGKYGVTVTDDSTGCKVDTILEVKEDTSFTITVEATKITSCGANDGTASVNATGVIGTPKYKWSNNATTQEIRDLHAGTYTVTVTDTSTKCEQIDSAVVEEFKPGIQILGGGYRFFCLNDPVSVTLNSSVSECSGCSYRWSNGSNQSSITIFSSNIYTLTISDDQGCSASAKVDVIIEKRDCDKPEWEVPVITSRDPNEIIGPAGFEAEKWVSVKDVLPYTILFENDPEFATAPAQRVEVTVPIDNTADIFSLRLGDLGFGGFFFHLPANSTFYSDRLDVYDSLGVVVDVTAGINVVNREAFWILQSIDPTTGLPPTDAEIGLLPVNDSITHKGEGFASFSIRPKTSVVTGDSIHAFAEIVFDGNDSVLTNTVINLVDALPPSSDLDPLPAISDSSTVLITWSGQDDPGGSGVRDYTLYVSVNGSGFQIYKEQIADTFFHFEGAGESTYTFYIIATDNTGNTESKNVAEATTTIRNECDDGDPCTVDLLVNDLCAHLPANCSFNISGEMASELGADIRGVTVSLTGSATDSAITAADGLYDFAVDLDGDYTVTPSKNNDSISNNGISTLDIVLMRKHILGVPLNSPYKIIAGDVNSSGSITTLDIVLTRNVVLQRSTAFPGGRQWVFVSSDFVFENTLDPFPYDSFRSYSNIDSDKLNQNFIGIKLGDVNNSWNPNIAKVGVTGEVQFVIDEYDVLPEQEIIVPVTVHNFNNIIGYQFTLSWDANVLSLMGVINRELAGNYGERRKNEGLLTTSWNDDLSNAISLSDDKTVFELKFKVTGEIGDSSEIKINSQMTASEAYDQNFDQLNVVPVNGMVKVTDATGSNMPNSGCCELKIIPNPFNNSTNIIFRIPESGRVHIVIYNHLGMQVKNLEGTYFAGEHIITWTGNNDAGKVVSNGLYHVQMTLGDHILNEKVILAK